LGKASGQKAAARDQNKPQDSTGTPAKLGQGSLQGAPLGSAERPIHVVGATDIPHGTAIEPSYNKALALSSKEDALYQKAAAAFETSPTADAN